MLDSAEQAKDFGEALGELLVRSARLDAASLDRGRRLARDQGERLDRVLTKLGLVGERHMAEALAELLGLPLVAAPVP